MCREVACSELTVGVTLFTASQSRTRDFCMQKFLRKKIDRVYFPVVFAEKYTRQQELSSTHPRAYRCYVFLLGMTGKEVRHIRLLRERYRKAGSEFGS